MNHADELKLKHRSMALMVLIAALWSIGGLFIKLIPWEPLQIAGLRSLIASLATALFMLLTHKRFRLNKWSLFTGINTGLVCAAFVFATKMTTAANAIVIQYSSPIFVLLISTVFLKKPLHWRDVAVVVTVFAGIALFFLDQLSPGNLAGNLIAILAGVFFALIFIGNSMAGDSDEMRFSGLIIGHGLCGLLTIPALLLYPFHPTPVDVGYILLLGVVQIAVPYILLAIAGKHCPALAGNLICSLEPILNPLWVLLFYGEQPGFFALIGSAVIIVSVVVWTITDAHAENAEQLKTAAGTEAPPRES